MRKLMLALGVGVVSLPLLFVLWLLLAVRTPKMDAITLRMPISLRALVANAIAGGSPWGKGAKPKMERVIRMDPGNAQAWTALCESYFGTEERTGDIPACRKAISLDPSAGNYNGLGVAEEKAGDNCAAADAYTSAAGKASSSGDYGYVERMGRAALRCGKAYDARAGLAAAIDLEKKSLAAPDKEDDEAEETRQDLLTDNEYLVVTFGQMHDEAHARSSCREAHPAWKGCSCSLDAKGEVSCEDAVR